VDRSDDDYYRTYKDEIPDNIKAAEYIRGCSIGAKDVEIEELAKLIQDGGLPEEVLKLLRVIALKIHNSFIKYNIEQYKVVEMEMRGNEQMEDLLEQVDKLNTLVMESMRIILNIKKVF